MKKKSPRHRDSDGQAGYVKPQKYEGILSQSGAALPLPAEIYSFNSTCPTPAATLAEMLANVIRHRQASGRRISRTLMLQAYRLQIEADVEQRFPDRKAVAA